jgi:alkyl sulfatase BDS1-like metallo-beta-lactamase superfamily hydrolase
MSRCSAGLAVALALACFTSSAEAQLRAQTPELIKVTDRIYSAVGYALGNVGYVTTDSGVVVIDTTESPQAATETLAAFRKVSDRPIRWVIYTHHHGDHVNGAMSFRGDMPRVIAQRLHSTEMRKYRLLMPYNTRLNAVQFGATLPKHERGLELAMDPRRPVLGYMPPTLTFDEEYKFTEGGTEFELYHTLGETYDHLLVWLPQSKALFPGDLIYPSFPMLASPMKPDRPILAWAESLDRMRKLKPEYLIPAHGPPVVGAARIEEMLKNYAEAIRFVHDQTVKRINAGLPLDQIRREVVLPERLASLPYLVESYGRVAWGVNGVFRQYTGFYDLDPANLNPGSRLELNRAMIEAAGGVGPILRRASEALGASQWQLALELCVAVLSFETENVDAHRIAADALDKLAAESINGVERNVYAAAALEHRQAIAVEDATTNAKASDTR